MTRPRTSTELRSEKRRDWFTREESKARESRGEQGAMEFWLRLTRSAIAKEIKGGRSDVWAAYALVNRLFLAAMQQRAAGERRTWDDLLKYAQAVVENNPPRY